MNFQFYCPQGHLLQSDTANAGATIACPICGTQFIVPPPPQSVLDAEKKAKGQTDDDEDDTEDEDEEDLLSFGSSSKKSKKQSFDFSNLGDDDDDDDEEDEDDEYDEDDEDDTDEEYDEDEDEDGEDDEDEDGEGFSFDMKNQQPASDLPPLHIPCPNGHVLEVSRDLLGEEAECPHCGEIFTLKRDNSLESINERYKKETKETTKISKQWFTFAIIVLVMFLGFMAYLMFN